jgi:hypothetical protein
MIIGSHSTATPKTYTDQECEEIYKVARKSQLSDRRKRADRGLGTFAAAVAARRYVRGGYLPVSGLWSLPSGPGFRDVAFIDCALVDFGGVWGSTGFDRTSRRGGLGSWLGRL